MIALEDKLRKKKEELSSPDGLFKNEQGAIDLASIMVGVIVIGLIGGVIAATVFAVIPWAQDAAAKHQLESIHTAENAYFGFSSSSLSSLPAGSKQNSFAASSELEGAGLLSKNKNYCAAVKPDSKTYGAYSLSATGKIWASDNNKIKPFVFNGTLPSACPELIATATLVGSTTPDGTTTYPYAGGSGSSGGSAAEDISSPGMGDGTTSSIAGTITGNSSGSYFPKNTAWLSAYGPVMSNTLPSPVLDLGGWSNPSSITASSTSVTATFKTNGTFTGVGGSWIYLIHADISCYIPSTKTYYNRTALLAGSLSGPYFSTNPGPNSSGQGVGCGPFAPPGAVLSQVLLRQATDAEWANYSLGYLGYCYTIPGLSEGWVNPYVPQQ